MQCFVFRSLHTFKCERNIVINNTHRLLLSYNNMDSNVSNPERRQSGKHVTGRRDDRYNRCESCGPVGIFKASHAGNLVSIHNYSI